MSCKVNPVWSGVCSKGTCGCDVDHSCAMCDGRPVDPLKSLCQAHFDALEPISDEEIKRAMGDGRKAAEAFSRSMRGRIWRWMR